VDQNKTTAKGNWKLFLVIAICAAPMIVSYLTYYVIKPQARTNYGTLLDPRLHPMPPLDPKAPDGTPVPLSSLKGKWIMLQAGGAECDARCKTKLFEMRQLRLTQGKNMGRIERIWLITDDKPLDNELMHEYEGTYFLRAKATAVQGWLPVEGSTSASDHIYLIDPLGNLMMRFPKDADPNKIKKDLTRLLMASSIG
jgi:cytochrome oxidase Cu insertion factor (SCO1/SenC/PrrC family)